MGYFRDQHIGLQEDFTYNPLHKTPEGWDHIEAGEEENIWDDEPDYNDGMEQEEPFEDDVIEGFSLWDD